MQTPEALNAAFASGRSHDVVVESLRFAGVTSVLDIGCGEGRLVSRLLDEGFVAAGVDPNDVALEKARTRAPAARFETAGAEQLPFETASFDAAVFLNSLHHVPIDRMSAALDEAGRVTGANSIILVVEPLAEGSYFEAMRPVEDETSIRGAAGAAIADAVRAERFHLRGNVVFNETVRFKNVDSFLSRLVAVDPARTTAAERHKSEVERLFHLHCQPDGTVFNLVQPIRIYWLSQAA
ncbi:class I SAM-dependent methyltransferase [Jiella mangrovi]|uniref:Class I SAM-dependent methyltransferase n=1 Tax=Jiella mangrovi TaxID=2821407 RepID=A0ABS4BKZ3_9HYPH|nr:class I SAM-dependent methyltransferase [Jiella mangrovi]MBP0617341.1 class I SAM-dependent methyltransferase [Jiella mangrovi]